MKIKKSLNVTFDESPPPTKLSPLVDDDVGEEEAIERKGSLYGLKQALGAWISEDFAAYAARVCYFRTPVDTDSKFSADGDPVSDPTLYHSLAGALQYLTFTRPDISYAVQQVCLYMHDHREPHFSALKRILRYIRGTMPYGLQLFSSTTSSLVAYSDADWAGCPTTRRSTSGYCVFLGNNLLSWSSKRQVTLSRSSAKAEYRSVANAVAETLPFISSNPVQHQRTKHIEIDIYFVHDLVAAGHIRVLHVPSRYQYADIFTKGLPTVLFDEFRSSLSVRSSPAQTAGGC
ncbi:ribonuclease H-like domain-containing protein [Tanacetum coccineum]